MNDQFEPEQDAVEKERKPRKARKRTEERRLYVYRMLDGKPKEQGSFPESTIGSPFERRLPMFLKDFFGPGDYKVETRKSNGHFEQSFDFTIGTLEAEPDDRGALNTENVDYEFDERHEHFGFETSPGLNSTEIENILLKERLKRIEDDLSRQKSGNQSEMQTLISALEESRREQRELMLMMLNKSQQPQQDATAQAMNILERSLGIVTKAKAISEEIAPTEQIGGGGFLADGAKLIDSLGRNAGTFLPLLMSGLQSAVPKVPVIPRPSEFAGAKAASNGERNDLTELAKKIKLKEETK